MYKLYGTRLTGTCAAHAALEEAGASYEVVEVDTREGEHLTENYRRINPRQQVPALELPGGEILTEGPAILIHIADAHPSSGLAPPFGSTARAQMNRWLVFLAVNVYEGELRKLFPERYTDRADGAAGVRSSAGAYVRRHYEILENAPAAPYFFGEDLSVLDIYVWMLCQWMDRVWLETHCPRITALAERVKVRPKIAPIHDLNFG